MKRQKRYFTMPYSFEHCVRKSCNLQQRGNDPQSCGLNRGTNNCAQSETIYYNQGDSVMGIEAAGVVKFEYEYFGEKFKHVAQASLFRKTATNTGSNLPEKEKAKKENQPVINNEKVDTGEKTKFWTVSTIIQSIAAASLLLYIVIGK